MYYEYTSNMHLIFRITDTISVIYLTIQDHIQAIDSSSRLEETQ